MTLSSMIMENISKPVGKSIKILHDLGIPKDTVIQFVTDMVNIFYADPTENHNIKKEDNNDKKKWYECIVDLKGQAF